MDKYRNFFESLLQKADIKVNGNRPWDLQVHNPQFFKRVKKEHELGLGESYMDGWWDCANIDEFFYRILRCDFTNYLKENFFINGTILRFGMSLFLQQVKHRLFNHQKKTRAFQVGKKHYDIGNELFSAMLDNELHYTCGYWKDSNTLDLAQTAKVKLICDKLNLQPGQKILDIGCGWGGFARYAAANYGVNVVGITISKEQKALAQSLCKNLPIEIRLQDYRDINESFDHLISIGMFEHVGYKNYLTYLQMAKRCLNENGLFLLHTIGSNETTTYANPWITKYIFPNGMIPSIKQIAHACENNFVIEDLHNFGVDYDKTLMSWFHNFNKNWSDLKHIYDDRFKRMWNYYLLSCAGAFRARYLQLWQIVLSTSGLIGGYNSVR